MGTIGNARGGGKEIAGTRLWIVSVCKTSYDSFDFIAGNRLFRYTMEVTGPHYTRGEITVCVYGRVYICVCVSVSRGGCMRVFIWVHVYVCDHIYI